MLTGAANTSESSASVAYGCVEDYPFIVSVYCKLSPLLYNRLAFISV